MLLLQYIYLNWNLVTYQKKIYNLSIFLFFFSILVKIIPTNEAFREIKSLVNHVKSQLKQRRVSYIREKEKIGPKIIDLGIMKEERLVSE